MKNNLLFFLVFSIFILMGNFCWGQNLFEENFDYGVGTKLENNGWMIKTGSSNSVVIESNNLSFPNYPSSSGGSINIDANGSCYYKPINNVYKSGSIYFSALLNISAAYNSSSDHYILSLGSNSAGSLAGKLYLKGNDSNFAFGISKTSDAPIYTDYIYNFNATYLVVIKYNIIDGSQNDNVSLYVIDGKIPMDDSSPTIAIASTSTNDPSTIETVYIRQELASNKANLDGIRVSTSWSLASLPVELTSFTGKLFSNKIYLKWSTATEINNFGFDIERTSSLRNWQKIGFVCGHGNCNSTNNYSYIDAEGWNDESALKPGIFYYRLKQIDNDGTFSYSKEIEVNLNSPSRFTLEQNYPNPFNPLTVIGFRLIEDSHVHLKVYDMLGNEVKTLVDENRKAGTHTVKFDASRLSSGVYMYKLTAAPSDEQAVNFTDVKKMLVLK